MKTLYEYLINEKRADLSDWSDEDKIIIGRSFASDRVLGYSMLELGKSSGPSMFNIVLDDLKSKYKNNPEGDNYMNLTHSVLNVIAHQLVDGASYKDAVKIEIDRIKSDSFLNNDVKDFLIDVIKDGAGKDTKDFKVHVTNQYSGFGSRGDMEKRLAKIKADPKNMHRQLPTSF